MKSRPRVLQVIGGLGVGGAETWLLALLRHWREQDGPQLDFLLTGGKEEALDAEARALGATLYYLEFSRRSPLRFVHRLRQILRRGAYLAIHDHCDMATGLHFAAAGSILPPVRVAHLHNHPKLFAENYLTSPGRRVLAALGKQLIMNRSTHVLATSDTVLRGFGFTSPGRRRPQCEVLYCGIHAEDFQRERGADRARLLAEHRWPADSLIALCVGRLDRETSYPHPTHHKNTAFSLEVARVAISMSERLGVIFVGGGDSRSLFEARVSEWGLSSRVRFVGLRRDLPSLMSAADVLLFPSTSEALGMAAVEAQAAGLGVLASDEVSREAVIFPERFRALPLQTSLDEWARQLLELADSPRPRPEECLAALEASPFSISHSARALECIYEGSVGDACANNRSSVRGGP